MAWILLQIDPSQTDAPTEEKLTILELLIKGGWIMVPLIALAVVAVFIFFERYFAIRKAAREDANFMNRIRDNVVNGNIEGALEFCRKTQTPIARMLEKGISRIGNPLKDINTSIENAGNLEVYKMEKNLPTLATISGAAPMIGFLGTVTGMIKAFYNLSKSGNNVDPSLLAGGIYEAMITTATGLAIGIIAFVGYNVLSSMVEKVVFKMEARTVEFIDILNEPA
jgi:biopolymer transport protein ExbB